MQAFNTAYKLLGRTTTKKGTTNGYVVELAYGGTKILSISEMVSIVSRGDIPGLQMVFISGKPEFYYKGKQLDSLLHIDNEQQNITSLRHIYGSKLYFWAQQKALTNCEKIFKSFRLTPDELKEARQAYTKPYIQALVRDLLDTVDVCQEIQFPCVVNYSTLDSDGGVGSPPTDKSMFIHADIQVLDMKTKLTATLRLGWQLRIDGSRLTEDQAKASLSGPILSDYCCESHILDNKHLAIKDLNTLIGANIRGGN